MLQDLLTFGERCSTPTILPTFPSTRYQGSKRKLLSFMSDVLMDYKFSSVLDLYSGTGTVSLLFRYMGKLVTANDYLRFNQATASFLLSISGHRFDWIAAHRLIDELFEPLGSEPTLVRDNYSGVYYPDDENADIDRFCANLDRLEGEMKMAMIYLMGQAMLMKRPYNLFHRANLSMRMSEVPRSFGNARTWEKPFSTHMKSLLKKLCGFPFDGPVGVATSFNTSDLEAFQSEPDLIYLDPPYLNEKGKPVDYMSFYHFLDGLVDYSLFGQGDPTYAHRPIRTATSRWKTSSGGLQELSAVMRRWPCSTLAISYRGDGRPSIGEIKDLLRSGRYTVDDHVATAYKYALSDATDTTEHLIMARPGVDQMN